MERRGKGPRHWWERLKGWMGFGFQKLVS